ncbi:MAG TPA: DUF4349 domain-containing protein [Thermoanaerobaculia bacterium]
MRRMIPALLILTLMACKKEEQARFADVASTASAASPVAQRQVNTRTEAQPQPQRMIIRSANISMIVDDTAAAIDKITAAGDSVGGYISDSKVWRDGEQLRGSITLRVPSDRLSAALMVIRKIAVRINSETIGTQEVTQEYVDLSSQLRNLQATEVELRQLMTTIRQNSKKASEVLEMYQQLASVRGQIDQITGRMRYLSQLSAFATLQVDLMPNALAKPVVEKGVWQPVVIAKDAARALVDALQSIASIAIWLGIYVLPMLAIIGLAVAVAWKLFGRFVRRSESAV